jgi:hypothetical protein
MSEDIDNILLRKANLEISIQTKCLFCRDSLEFNDLQKDRYSVCNLLRNTDMAYNQLLSKIQDYRVPFTFLGKYLCSLVLYNCVKIYRKLKHVID